ncbi:MAG: zinc ribbon domain-containing protein [Anaerolineae bacterium]|nr:zinc ribbon domain-containing protein [Anaerolineae bacterium]
MPVYIYHCEECDACFEVTHTISACGMTWPCPVCGSDDTHRVPQPHFVNWGGLAPSQGRLASRWCNLVDESNRQRRVDKYREEKARRSEWQ